VGELSKSRLIKFAKLNLEGVSEKLKVAHLLKELIKVAQLKELIQTKGQGRR
jgi:hypothetical protein